MVCSLLVVCSFLHACSLQADNKRFIATNIYDAQNLHTRVDSLNQTIREYGMPFAFSVDSGELSLTVHDYYVIRTDTLERCFCIESIEELDTYYLLELYEYLCGYSYWFIYEKQTGLLYKSVPIDAEDYEIATDHCNFSNYTIGIKYDNRDTIDVLPFFECSAREMKY